MAGIYTVSLMDVALGAGGTHTYTSPAEIVTIVTNLTAYSGGVTANGRLGALETGLAGFVAAAPKETAGGDSTWVWTGKIVLQPGQTLTFEAIFAAGVHIVGYQLEE